MDKDLEIFYKTYFKIEKIAKNEAKEFNFKYDKFVVYKGHLQFWFLDEFGMSKFRNVEYEEINDKIKEGGRDDKRK